MGGLIAIKILHSENYHINKPFFYFINITNEEKNCPVSPF